MKKFILAVILVTAAVVVGWLIWFMPGHDKAEQIPAETDVPVRVAKIIRTTLHRYVTAYGMVDAEPSGAQPAASSRIAAPIPGVVAAVNCAEGQAVERGAILVQLDSRAADVAAQRASQTIAFVEQQLERQKKLLAVEGTSQKLFLESKQALAGARNDLAAAQTQQALLQIQSPLAGTVVHLNVGPGEAVDLTTVIAEVIDLDRLVVSANIPTAELTALRPGQRVEVFTEMSVAPVAGSLAYVSPEVDAKTGTALVRAALPAKSGLRPGQWVTLRIVSEERQDRLAVPIESVTSDAEGVTVIAVVQNDRAVQTPVRPGLRDNGWVEIDGEGLQADMMVVTEGAYGLPKETRVQVLEQ